MADKTLRLTTNTAGSYYVTDDCIDCDMCREHASRIFSRDASTSYSYVHRQPETDEERQLADEAIEGCPADAIGNDG